MANCSELEELQCEKHVRRNGSTVGNEQVIIVGRAQGDLAVESGDGL